MFNKSLIQVSVDGQGCQTMEEVIKIMATSLKRPDASLSAPAPVAGCL